MLTSVVVMPESLPITLTYDGLEVRDGSMPVEQIIDALQGFSGAYGKVASLVDAEKTHEIRVSAVRQGSFSVELVVLWNVLTSAEGKIKTLETIGGAAKKVYELLVGVIRAKKHTKGEDYTYKIEGSNNTVIVLNGENASLTMAPQAFEIFQNKLIDPDLKKIASPLREGRVDTVEIKAKDEPTELITAADRDSFKTTTVTTSRQMELTGRLESYNKVSNRGTFRLGTDGIPYRFVGEATDKFLTEFSYTGPVEVSCIAQFEDSHSLVPTSLEISKVTRLQFELPMASEDDIKGLLE